MISPGAHREILADFGQDGTVIRRGLALLLSCALALTIYPSSAAAAKKKRVPNPPPIESWPPEGFREKDGVYAKVPKWREVVGQLSPKKFPQKDVATCKEFACGAVLAAAETGCEWWEVNSSVRRMDPITQVRERIGTLVTIAKGTKERKLATIILVSGELLDSSISIGNIKVICHREPGAKPKPGNVYNPIVVKAN